MVSHLTLDQAIEGSSPSSGATSLADFNACAITPGLNFGRHPLQSLHMPSPLRNLERSFRLARERYAALGVDVILDDRGERPGAMFADWELIGVPHRVVLSDRGLKEGQVEYQGRRDAEATKLALADVVAHLKAQLKLA